MREIKFWDKTCWKMYNDMPIAVLISIVKLGDETFNKSIKELEKYYILIQDTGFKDRNNKRIFEGDILRGTGIDNTIRTWEALGLDNFHHWQETKDLIEEYGDIEVIGNVYENPELLTKNKLQLN